MKVSNLLANKGHDVATISRERSVADALELLKERDIGALVVTALNQPLAGIISERDIVRALARQGAVALTLSVSDIMTSDVRVCDEATLVTTLMGLMTTQHIRHVPVIRGDQVIGLVSIGDVVKARFDELEHEKQELIEYVSAR